MIDISVSDLVKSFDLEKKILDGVSFTVNSGERVGLLGKNGAGKSTLFRILTGEIDCDSGEVAIASGRRVGLISQIPVYPEGYTVDDVLDTAFVRIHKMEKEMSDIAERMERGESGKELLRRDGELSAAFEGMGGYDTRTMINKVAAGLSIPEDMRRRMFSELSGGEKTRVNLARLILEDTDILLLDEPTNHLDLHATEWLEDYLSRFRGSVLAISHDRYFLDRVVSRIVEIEDGKAEFYSGNYSFYVDEKERRYEERLRRYEKEQAKIEQLTEAAEKMRLWAFMGNDKLYKRAFSMEKRMEKMRTTDRPTRERALGARFSERGFEGDEVLSLRGVGMSFGQRKLFSGLELKVVGGERIALIGDNGTGKSTLIKIILGGEQPTEGRVKTGPSVRAAYLPQIVEFDAPERSLVDTMIYAKNCTAQSARNMLAAFRFTGEDALKSVSILSGGERSRLKLCMLMDDEINLLVLDEPTNHLDIASREWMEQAVEEYGGTLIFVSHDRYFIKRFATRIWELENNTITDYQMGYDAYRAAKAAEKTPEPAHAEKKAEKKAEPRGGREKSAARRQLTICERDIAKAEERLRELDAEMEANACDYEKMSGLFETKNAAQKELDALYDKWSALAEEAGE
jgi:ATPase subunit of ABC transporter with duplicated ATPase domains